MLVKLLDAYTIKKEFEKMDRDYFSIDGYKWILDLFEEVDCGKATELDVIAICCDFSEDTPDNIYNNYNHIDEISNCMEDGELDIDSLLDELGNYTICGLLDNGNIIYQVF